MASRTLSGSLGAACATILIGGAFAASSQIAGYPVFGGQAARYAASALLLVVLLRARGERLQAPHAGDLPRLLALAASGLAGFNVCVVAAVRETDPALVGIVVGCLPVVLALAGPLLERHAPSGRLLLAAVVVTAGAAAAQGTAGRASLAGLAWSVGALGCEAAFSLLAVPLLPRLGPVRVSAYVTMAAAVMLLCAGLVADGAGAMVQPTVAELGGLTYLAIATPVAFVAWYAGIERVGVERAGLFAGLIPVSALLSSAAIGAGEIAPARLAGAGLVGLGVALGLSSRVAAASPATAPPAFIGEELRPGAAD